MNSLLSLTARSRFFGKVARGFNVPAGLLVMLLQRTPVLRVAATAGEFMVASPVGTVLKAVIATAATLGTIDSVAGATTQLQTTSTLPALATVGKPFTMAIYITGTGVSFAQSWDISNTLPPGVTADGGGGHGGATVQGSLLVINISTGTLTFSGTPTAAGTYSFTAEGYQYPNRTGPVTPGSSYIIVAPAAATAPVIATQPQSQTVPVGSNVQFTVVGSGTPSPTYQWSKGGVNIPGAIGTYLSLANVQLTDAGTYTVTASNSAGNVTSNGAVLTVLSSPPAITAQPQSQTDPVGAAAIFMVTATGAPAPTYQWQDNGTNIPGANSNTLVISSVQPTDAGNYTVVVSNAGGSITSNPAVLTVNPAAPTITAGPVSHTVAIGSTTVLDVQATGTSLAYQWMKNGVPIAGATAVSLIISNAQPSDAGSYTVSLTNSGGSVTSNPATLGVVTTTTPGRLINLSTRGQVGTGANAMIVGFVISGTAAKPVIIRGVGPTLVSYGVAGTLPDPQLTLQLSGNSNVVAQNDNWATAGDPATVTAAMARLGAFPLPTGSLDSVIYTTLAPGVYTATLSGNGVNNTGVGIVEVYDNTVTLDSTSPHLANISTRGVVGTGASVMIPGFVIAGSTAKTVLIRCVGPTLGNYGVAGILADPIIYLNDSHGTVIYQNDNWGSAGDSAQIVSAATTTGAFALTAGSKDSALLVTLPPGSYTVTVSGVNNTTGIALVEVYELP